LQDDDGTSEGVYQGLIIKLPLTIFSFRIFPNGDISHIEEVDLECDVVSFGFQF
jgi:hypothetical protein